MLIDGRERMEAVVAIARQKEWHPSELGGCRRCQGRCKDVSRTAKSTSTCTLYSCTLYSLLFLYGKDRRSRKGRGEGYETMKKEGGKIDGTRTYKLSCYKEQRAFRLCHLVSSWEDLQGFPGRADNRGGVSARYINNICSWKTTGTYRLVRLAFGIDQIFEIPSGRRGFFDSCIRSLLRALVQNRPENTFTDLLKVLRRSCIVD